ncbi:hypothetical protein [Paraburkholderia fungorum]
MVEKIQPFKFSPHAGDVGHTIAFGPISGGKTVPEELLKLWAVGHPGDSSSVAQADDDSGQ